MTETITPQKFHQAAGIEDWRVLTNVAHAHFRTGSFTEGVALVDAMGRLAEQAGHQPDVDLRPDGVTVRLTTTTPDHFFWLSDRDVELARQISAAARELGVAADPSSVQMVQVTIDALVHPEVMPFWRAVLGYRQLGDEDLLDPHSSGPPF
jgi:4a-hydroxytetrahydrobiopterin dehydratase